MTTSRRPVSLSRRQRAPRHGGSRWGLRPVLVLALAGALIASTGAVVRAASDDPEIQTVKLQLTGGHYTAKVLSLDTDGDGWTDWVERLHGTDPKDPGSHPLASHVEIVGTTAYVQSRDVPDHLVVIDLALPEGTTKTADLMAVVGDLVGLSPTGKLREQLTSGLAQLGSGRLDEIMKLADEAHASTGGTPGRTNGMDLSLISAGSSNWESWQKALDAVDFVQNNDIGVGTTTDGDPYVTVTNNEGSQTHVFGGDGISSTLVNKVTEDDGTVVEHWQRIENGVVVGYGKKVTKADGSQEYWDWDANGNPTGHGTSNTPPKGGSTPAPSGPAQSAAPAPSSQPSSEPAPSSDPSTQPSSDPAPSATSSTYVNPDADPITLPSRREIEKRIAFLSGVRVRIVQHGPMTPETPIIDEPGVADPADPACKGQMCPMFVVVFSPDLSDVNGGDPINPDHAPGIPGQGFQGSYGEDGYGEVTSGWPDRP